MYQLVINVNLVISLLTFFGDVLITLLSFSLLAYFLHKPSKKILKRSFSFFSEYALLLTFIVALTSMVGSLFFSDVAGYAPCILCWYQRTLMYPQVFLAGLALVKKDRKIFDYLIMLSSIGAFIALYHYYLQLGGSSILATCSAFGGASCSQKLVLGFEYVTIPVMSLTAFLLMALFSIIGKISSSSGK